SRCSISPSSNQVIVCNPMCGCAATSTGLLEVKDSGPYRSRKHHGPIMRRSRTGNARQTVSGPTTASRRADAETSPAMAADLSVASTSVTGANTVIASAHGFQRLQQFLETVTGLMTRAVDEERGRAVHPAAYPAHEIFLDSLGERVR